MISETIKRLPLKELTEQEHRCFEMALLALNAGNYEDCERFTNYGFELDSAVKSGKIEKRYNDGSHYKKGEHGHFAGSTPYASGGGSGSSGGGKGTGNKRNKYPKMSRKEINRVTHGIATDFPRLKPDGVRRKYEYGNYQYDFYVHDFASYEFVAKRRLK